MNTANIDCEKVKAPDWQVTLPGGSGAGSSDLLAGLDRATGGIAHVSDSTSHPSASMLGKLGSAANVVSMLDTLANGTVEQQAKALFDLGIGSSVASVAMRLGGSGGLGGIIGMAVVSAADSAGAGDVISELSHKYLDRYDVRRVGNDILIRDSDGQWFSKDALASLTNELFQDGTQQVGPQSFSDWEVNRAIARRSVDSAFGVVFGGEPDVRPAGIDDQQWAAIKEQVANRAMASEAVSGLAELGYEFDTLYDYSVENGVKRYTDRTDPSRYYEIDGERVSYIHGDEGRIDVDPDSRTAIQTFYEDGQAYVQRIDSNGQMISEPEPGWINNGIAMTEDQLGDEIDQIKATIAEVDEMRDANGSLSLALSSGRDDNARRLVELTEARNELLKAQGRDDECEPVPEDCIPWQENGNRTPVTEAEYTVQSGDTVSTIMNRMGYDYDGPDGVNTRMFKAVNGLDGRDGVDCDGDEIHDIRIKAGDKLLDPYKALGVEPGSMRSADVDLLRGRMDQLSAEQRRTVLRENEGLLHNPADGEAMQTPGASGLPGSSQRPDLTAPQTSQRGPNPSRDWSVTGAQIEATNALNDPATPVADIYRSGAMELSLPATADGRATLPQGPAVDGAPAGAEISIAEQIEPYGQGLMQGVNLVRNIQSGDTMGAVQSGLGLASQAGLIDAGPMGSVLGLASAVQDGDIGGMLSSGASLANIPNAGYVGAAVSLLEGDVTGAAISAMQTAMMSVGPYGWVVSAAMMIPGVGETVYKVFDSLVGGGRSLGEIMGDEWQENTRLGGQSDVVGAHERRQFNAHGAMFSGPDAQGLGAYLQQQLGTDPDIQIEQAGDKVRVLSQGAPLDHAALDAASEAYAAMDPAERQRYQIPGQSADAPAPAPVAESTGALPDGWEAFEERGGSTRISSNRETAGVEIDLIFDPKNGLQVLEDGLPLPKGTEYEREALELVPASVLAMAGLAPTAEAKDPDQERERELEEQQQLAAEQERERLEQERLEQERIEQERLERERQEAEKRARRRGRDDWEPDR